MPFPDKLRYLHLRLNEPDDAFERHSEDVRLHRRGQDGGRGAGPLLGGGEPESVIYVYPACF